MTNWTELNTLNKPWTNWVWLNQLKKYGRSSKAVSFTGTARKLLLYRVFFDRSICRSQVRSHEKQDWSPSVPFSIPNILLQIRPSCWHGTSGLPACRDLSHGSLCQFREPALRCHWPSVGFGLSKPNDGLTAQKEKSMTSKSLVSTRPQNDLVSTWPMVLMERHTWPEKGCGEGGLHLDQVLLRVRENLVSRKDDRLIRRADHLGIRIIRRDGKWLGLGKPAERQWAGFSSR